MHEYACIFLTCLYMDSGNLIPGPLDDATSALPTEQSPSPKLSLIKCFLLKLYSPGY